MNLRQMEVFQAVMREGTVTAGARLLGLSQPTVTEMLKHTESRLGFALFDRVKGKLRPTVEARLLYDEIEEIFDRIGAFRRSSEGLRDLQLGSLAVATISALGLSMVPTLMGRFMASRPEVRARLLVKRRFDLAGAVAAEGVDVGFAFQSPTDARITRHEIARRPLVVITPAGHPLASGATVSVPDMAGWPIVTYAASHGLGAMIDGLLSGAGIRSKPVVEVDDVAQAWALVQTGIGIAIVDPYSGLGDLFPGVSSRPLASPQCLVLEALLSTQRPRSLLAEAFLADVGEAFRS